MRGVDMAGHAVGAESVLVELFRVCSCRTVQICLLKRFRSACRNGSDLLVETVQIFL